ncbi:MAG: SDR family oxidoreductase [Deltaproteobacteria bacterium]|nr:SDR family oxidoreductase [Deltaproteobacteria bacterium]
MDLGIAGKTALVCASSRGLGRACAQSLAREGARVAMAARTERPLEEAAREIGALAVKADVSLEADRVALVQRVVAELGPVEILVNNAGGPPAGRFAAHDVEAWRDAMELNLVSAVHLTGLVLPGMIEAGSGRIINIVSIAGLEAVDDLILSNASRPAVLGWTRALAREVAASGVGVAAVCPGLFLTNRIRQLVKIRAERSGMSDEEALSSWASTIPSGRLGRPEELGDLVAFLASPRAAYINGAALSIDGGLVRRLS